jgi:hypothetical protein
VLSSLGTEVLWAIFVLYGREKGREQATRGLTPASADAILASWRSHRSTSS